METYPRQAAATGQFRHGQPRGFRVTDQAVYFLRSGGSRDPRLELLRWDRSSHRTEAILSGQHEALSSAERALRERMRESATGVTAFDVHNDRVVASAGGAILSWDAQNGARTVVPASGAFDPRLSPDGRWITWIADGGLHLQAWDGSQHRVLAQAEGTISWGVADFIAAEELGRSRGYWWLSDSAGLLVQRTDEAGVPIWYRSDPARPDSPPTPQRYPHAGAANAQVQLWRFELSGHCEQITLPESEYLVSAGGLITVFNRSQTVLTVCDEQGVTITTLEQSPWLDLVPGLPRRDESGRLLAWRDEKVRRLTIDAEPVTPATVHLRAVVGEAGDDVLVLACKHPSDSRLARVGPRGFEWLSAASAFTTATAEAGLIITAEADWGTTRANYTIRDQQYVQLATIDNLAEEPIVTAVPEIIVEGRNEVQTVALWPTDPVDGPLPVLMSPYGGPHGQRVVAARSAYSSAQWLADQGFCVIVADGRGTPGHSPAWEHTIAGNLLDPAVDDQIRALEAVIAQHGDSIDTSRVGIMGWSFGGYLAAAAIMLRPDVFHAAVAGAPVTEWQLYDTAYTERYLGTPQENPEDYDHCSLLHRAGQLQRPLLLIHGLSDDNVFAAHTLQLSTRLVHSGRPHQVLPLSGVTHMTPQPEVAENLQLLQLDFLRKALAIGG